MPNRPQPKRNPAAPRDSRHSPQAPLVFEPVNPAWIVKALAAMLVLALLCGYITLCLVFWYTQWQIVLHPSRTVATNPAALGLDSTEIHFADNGAGQPQLDGWWIPAAPSTQPTTTPANQPTALLLHGGNGSMADALPQAQLLHNAGLNVLLFDYRGYGRSAGYHPAQALMQADAQSAYTYLIATRSIATQSIVVFGDGLGASLAVHLCAQHPQLPALILDSPNGDLAPQVRADSRSHLLPFSLLFHEDFALAAPLRTLTVPKLIFTSAGAVPPAIEQAAEPRTLVPVRPADPAAIQQALTLFLARYLPRPPA